MSNQMLTISQITREALLNLKNNLAMANNVTRDYDSQFANTGAKIGTTINVRKPPRYTVSTGPALQVQDATETYVPLTLTTQAHVDIAFTSADLTLNIDDFAKRFLTPAMIALANKIDYDGGQLYSKIYNMVGTPGTTPATALAILGAGQRLDEEGAPYDADRALIVNPATQAALVNGLAGYFNAPQKISSQYTRGRMGDQTLGFNFTMDQNIPVHTYGTSTSGANPTVNGAQAATAPSTDQTTGFNLTTNAITGTVKAGTVVTIANVYAVNPQNRQSTGQLRQFVVTSDTLASATTLPIFPAPIFSGPFQNCTSTTGNIANGATITLPNSSGGSQHAQNLAFHKNAIALGTADLIMPSGVDMAARESYEGISLRIVRQFDINSDTFPCRIDVLYGWQVLYPELACRLTA